jgi:hypothetical protein
MFDQHPEFVAQKTVEGAREAFNFLDRLHAAGTVVAAVATGAEKALMSVLRGQRVLATDDAIPTAVLHQIYSLIRYERAEFAKTKEIAHAHIGKKFT